MTEPVTITERVSVMIPGLERPYTFLHISDTHITHAYENDSDAGKALAEKQAHAWNQAGIFPVDAFANVLEYADETKPDAILMAGDVVDYYTESNVRYLGEMLSACKTECLYVPGNHEYAGNAIFDDMRATLSPLMKGTPDFWVRDFGAFVIVGVCDGTYRFTAEQVEKLKAVIAQGKPILMMLHLPIRSDVLSPYVAKSWWGSDVTIGGTFHGTDEPTEEFLALVKSEESRVAAIFAGHLHYDHAGEFAPGRMQYVSAPAFTRFVREVSVIPG